MAVRGQEVELLKGGIKAEAPSKGPFALNMLHRNGAWEVRSGLGQVTQLDTNMSGRVGSWQASGSAQVSVAGYRDHLGSEIIRTSFGHEQILSVFRSTVSTGNEDTDKTGTKPRFYSVRDIWIVSIYDLTTGHRWEEPLYRRTGEGSRTSVPMSKWHGIQETCIGSDYQSWLEATDREFFFHKDSGILYFGNPDAGLWAYIPGTFRSSRSKSLGVVSRQNVKGAYSESSLVTRVIPSQGSLFEGYAYFTPSEFPGPVDMTSAGGRLVYGSGRTVLFSDVGQPAHVTGDNFFTLPSRQEITAVESFMDNVVIFTPTETWLYRLSTGDTASQGTLTKISDSVGCSGPNAAIRAAGTVLWAGSVGVFALSGDLEPRELSKDISRVFSDFITSPMNSYALQAGWHDLNTQQPIHNISFNPKKAHLVFNPELDALFLGMPEENVALCLSDGDKWALWSYESAVYYTSAESRVGTTANIPGPWMLSTDTKLFVVTQPERQSLEVESTTDAGFTFDAQHYDSYSSAILEYGRGGGIDRSILDEDHRVLAGAYHRLYRTEGTTMTFIIDKPIMMEPGYTLPSGTTPGSSGFWLPIRLVVPFGFFGIKEIRLQFRYRSDHFTPICHPDSTGQIDYYLPPERGTSDAGWDWAAAQISPGARAFDATTGASSNTGNQISIHWDGDSETGWTHQPIMNMTAETVNDLIYIPFIRDPTKHSAGMDFQITSLFGGTVSFVKGHNSIGGDVSLTDGANITVWDQWWLPAADGDPDTETLRGQDDLAQPVDWAYQTDVAGLDSGSYKSRGLNIRALSHGPGVSSDLLEGSWRYGLLNTMVSSDHKGWVSQVVDFTGQSSLLPAAIQEVVNKASIRTRVSTGATLSNKTFNTTGVTYGSSVDDPTNRAHGTYLIDDEEVSLIATSDSVKGEGFTYMVFGFMQSRAHRVVIESIRAIFRVLGGKRRGGR